MYIPLHCTVVQFQCAVEISKSKHDIYLVNLIHGNVPEETDLSLKKKKKNFHSKNYAATYKICWLLHFEFTKIQSSHSPNYALKTQNTISIYTFYGKQKTGV